MANQHFLPSILQDQALYLGGGGRIPPYRVPRPYQPWLLDRGSLTRRLIQASAGDFAVKLLRQGHQRATDHEREALQLEQRSWPFLREVALLCQRHASDYRLLDTTDAESIYTLIRQVDGLRRPERLTSFCSAIEYGTPSSKQQLLQTSVTAIKQVDSAELQSLDLKGKAFADALKVEQIKAIEEQLNY